MGAWAWETVGQEPQRFPRVVVRGMGEAPVFPQEECNSAGLEGQGTMKECWLQCLEWNLGQEELGENARGSKLVIKCCSWGSE